MSQRLASMRCSATEIASLVGVTPRNIRQYSEDGIIPYELSGNKKTYRPIDAVTAYCNSIRSKKGAKGTTVAEGSLEEAKLQAEVDYKEAQAKVAQLNLAEIEGRMHSAEDVEALVSDLILAVRSNLLSLPGRLAMDILDCKTAPEASELIKKEVVDMLDDLSKYEYNPEEYHRRVVERQGWVQSEESDEED